jgi:hypothetical protein
VKNLAVDLNDPVLTKDALYYDYASAANPTYQKSSARSLAGLFLPIFSSPALHASNRST